MNFENRLELGKGIYTIPDIAHILRLPNTKVNRWLTKFWDDKLGSYYNTKYSWNIDLTKAVSFHTLIELYTFYQLNEAGVKSSKILEAHNILSHEYETAFPFATLDILNQVHTDGKNVIFELSKEKYYSVDISRQFKLDFIKLFFKKLDFDYTSLANRLWPLGKDKSIVCDPNHQFGYPVIHNTNTTPEVLNELFIAGEPLSFIAELYEVNENQVRDAIEYCKKAA